MMTFHKRPWTRSVMMTLRYGTWPYWLVELSTVVIVAYVLLMG
jgi:hypothetical protein